MDYGEGCNDKWEDEVEGEESGEGGLVLLRILLRFIRLGLCQCMGLLREDW